MAVPYLSATIALRFGSSIALVRKVQSAIRFAISARPYKTRRQKVCLAFLVRGLVATDSVLLLFSAGLETDARSITRTLAELWIDLAWILHTDQDARILLFLEYALVTIQRMTDATATLSAASGLESPSEEIPYFVGLAAIYSSVYLMGCLATHSGPATLFSVAQETPQGLPTLSSFPAEPAHDVTLGAAASCLLGIANLAAADIGADFGARISPLFDEHREVFEKGP